MFVLSSTLTARSGSESGYETANLNDLPDFSMVGDTTTFEPEYYPERVRVGKERNLSRNPGLCGDEEVNDIGSKNRSIHLRGFILGFEKKDFHSAVNSGDEFKMVSMPWSGHVYIKDSRLEGPIGIEKHNIQGKQWVYEYTMDVVASGSHTNTSGIIDGSGGTSVDTNGPAWGL